MVKTYKEITILNREEASVWKNEKRLPKSIDIYFQPDYGLACEVSENAVWECSLYKTIIYVYLKKSITVFDTTHYDLITPYGYSGFYYDSKNTEKNLDINIYSEFMVKFLELCVREKYITELVRQYPYTYSNHELLINSGYNLMMEKTIYSVDLASYKSIEEYKKELGRTTRRMVSLGDKNFQFELKNVDDGSLSILKELYLLTMDRLSSSEYYKFSPQYFDCFKRISSKIVIVYLGKKPIASLLILIAQNGFIHYHIGGSIISEETKGCNNYIHYKTVEYGITNGFQRYVFGCGLKEGDALAIFKEKMSNSQKKYRVYNKINNFKAYDSLAKNYNTKDSSFFPVYRS